VSALVVFLWNFLAKKWVLFHRKSSSKEI